MITDHLTSLAGDTLFICDGQIYYMGDWLRRQGRKNTDGLTSIILTPENVQGVAIGHADQEIMLFASDSDRTLWRVFHDQVPQFIATDVTFVSVRSNTHYDQASIWVGKIDGSISQLDTSGELMRVIRTTNLPPTYPVNLLFWQENIVMLGMDGLVYVANTKRRSLDRGIDWVIRELDKLEIAKITLRSEYEKASVDMLDRKGKVYNLQIFDELFDQGRGLGFIFVEPQRISPAFEVVIDLASGEQHAVMLTEKGHVYTTGSNEFGQLGRLVSFFNISPYKLELPPIGAISAGDTYTNVVTQHKGELIRLGGVRLEKKDSPISQVQHRCS
ncbi:MAG: RCC1 domain-containing protein [Gallionella sp.]|jgi:hypothetical protein